MAVGCGSPTSCALLALALGAWQKTGSWPMVWPPAMARATLFSVWRYTAPLAPTTCTHINTSYKKTHTQIHTIELWYIAVAQIHCFFCFCFFFSFSASSSSSSAAVAPFSFSFSCPVSCGMHERTRF
uniref:Secreted protein n=1 Tax=Anopheles darlingi TaxID=43151 RepID=A0A2M4DDA9_ANODA